MIDTPPHTIPASAITPGHIGSNVMFDVGGATVRDVLASLQAAAPSEHETRRRASDGFPPKPAAILLGLQAVRPMYDAHRKEGGYVFEVHPDTRITVTP